jgi:hypothetical protein
MPFETLTAEVNEGEGSPWWKWEIGVEKPYPDTITTWLMADGMELDYIKTNFVNIPMNNAAKKMKWHGEMARFIYDNL